MNGPLSKRRALLLASLDEDHGPEMSEAELADLAQRAREREARRDRRQREQGERILADYLTPGPRWPTPAAPTSPTCSERGHDQPEGGKLVRAHSSSPRTRVPWSRTQLACSEAQAAACGDRSRVSVRSAA